jgi:hypothetical protein
VRLVQLESAEGARRVAIVEGDRLRLIGRCDSVYALAQAALARGVPLAEAVTERASGETIDYDPVYRLDSEWRLLAPFSHPEPARLLVSGTGLTHKASADNRQAMHRKPEELSDSMRMYLDGLQGGRPAAGEIGVSPEWFYKGCGSILRAHGEPLDIPNFAGDGGEEPEVAGAYVIDEQERPRRVGMVMANEFSDHVLEKQNYLFLAHSKLRVCSIGPELVVDPDFRDVRGMVSVERGGRTLWSKPIATGETNMSHTVANLEHHHFKYTVHRRPGDAHLHFFGADAFSFGDGIRLEDGDVTVVAFEGFGRPLRNPIHVDRAAREFVAVTPV